MAAQLAPLPEVARLSPRCLRVLGGNPGKFTLQGTNTYLLGTGKQRLLVDTGEGQASWAAALARTLQAEKATLAAVLITHWHADHVGGIDQVRQLVPGVDVYQSRLGLGGLATATADLVDGQEFRVEGATLRAVHTPGHTTNHMAFVLAEENAVLAGDNVLGVGTAVFEDLAVYLQSLARMRELYRDGEGSSSGGVSSSSSGSSTSSTSHRLYPGHGPVVDDGPAKIAEYISHRQQREDQVVRLLQSPSQLQPQSNAATAAATWTPLQLVEVIYADVRKDLHPAAERGLVQILHKLEKEGRVVCDADSGAWALARSRSPL